MTQRFRYRSGGCCFSLMTYCHVEHVCCNEALQYSGPGRIKRGGQTMLEGTISGNLRSLDRNMLDV